VTTRESDESWRKGQGVPPYDETLEATLAADGDDTVLVVELKGTPLDAVAFYGAGGRSTQRILPPTSQGVNPATASRGGTSSSRSIRHRLPTLASPCRLF
jgi:hypothetical protein